jgi:transcriptional regulator with XRE-family HTH domain
MHTGKKIKLLRTIKNLTQEELAEKINKTRALVSHIEQTGKVNHYTLTLILKVLNISFPDFENFNDKEILKGSSVLYASSEELIVLKDKIENYQKENALLKDLVDSLKKIIEALEYKNGRKK